jgi:hypothetical protein
MSQSSDEIIRQAMERGEFQDLPNKGKKLDLSDYFDTPDEVRLGYSLLKSNAFVPEEVQMLKEIEALQEKVQQAKDKAARQQIQKEIELRRLKYNLLMDRFHRRHS